MIINLHVFNPCGGEREQSHSVFITEHIWGKLSIGIISELVSIIQQGFISHTYTAVTLHYVIKVWLHKGLTL